MRNNYAALKASVKKEENPSRGESSIILFLLFMSKVIMSVMPNTGIFADVTNLSRTVEKDSPKLKDEGVCTMSCKYHPGGYIHVSLVPRPHHQKEGKGSGDFGRFS